MNENDTRCNTHGERPCQSGDTLLALTPVEQLVINICTHYVMEFQTGRPEIRTLTRGTTYIGAERRRRLSEALRAARRYILSRSDEETARSLASPSRAIIAACEGLTSRDLLTEMSAIAEVCDGGPHF